MMKRLFLCSLAIVLLASSVTSAALSYGASYYRQHKGTVGAMNYNVDPLWLFMNEVETTLEGGGGVDSLVFTPGTQPSTASEGEVYYDSASNGLLLYNGSTWVTIDTAGASSLDTAYGVGSTIDVDGDAVTLTVSNTDNNRVLDLVQNDVTNNPVAMLITNTGTGSGLTFATTGTYDARGTSNLWSLTAAGAVVGTALQAGNGDLTFTEPTTNDVYLLADADAQLTIGGTSKEDIDLNFATSNTLTLSSGTGTDTIAFGGVDDLTGVGTIAFDAAASSISLAASGDAQDLTIQVTGAHNSSLDLRSAGTGADAIKVYASAGGIDVDGTGSTMTMTNTANGSNDDFTIEVAGTQDSSLILQSAGTGGDALSLITSNTAGDIKINSGDMLDIDAADDILIDLAGAAGEDILITNTGGSIKLSATESAADSIVIQSTLGGIDIQCDAASAGEDIDITNTGGSINILASENDAAAIVIGTNGGSTEQINITNTQGTADAAVAITATAGGIALDAAGKLSIDSADDMSIKLTSSTDAEDLTIQVDGDDNCSIILDSDGTGTDAIRLYASNAAGGMDIDAGTNGIDIDVTGGDFAIDNSGAGKNITMDAAAGSVYIDGGEAAVNAIVIDASNAAGGIDMDSGTNGFDLTVTGGDITLQNTGTKDIVIDATEGRVLITGTESAADAIILTADGAAGEISLNANTGGLDLNAASGDIKLDVAGNANDDITLTNTNGTGASAIAFVATAGGITATVADEKDLKIGNAGGDAYLIVAASATAGNEDVRMVNTNGTNAKAIEILSSAGGISIEGADEKEMYIGNDAADTYVKVAPSATPASEIISLVNAAGTAAGAIALQSTAGGITAKVADEKDLQIGNNALDAYFIVAASATAGNEDCRVVNTNGTNAKAIEILASAGGVAIEGADEKEIYIGNDAKDAYVSVAASATAGDEDVRIINTNGTDEGAIVLTSTAGGVDINANAAKDIALGGGQILAVAGHNTADAILLHADAGASQTIRLVNDEGTSVTEDAGAIQLSATAGGIQIQSDGNLDDAVCIRADGGTTAEMSIHNDRGTSESSIEIVSDDGGIDITCATGKNMDLTGGQITLLSNEAATSAIALTTNTGAAETIVITNTLGNTADAITLAASAGGLNIDGSTSTISIVNTADGAGDDLTIQVDGDQNSSIILDSDGTAADAIKINASNAAGGIDVDFGTNDMVVTGTGASADFTLDCDLFSIDGTGTSNITVTANAGGEDFTVEQGGSVDASLVLTSDGTAADATQVTATAGGIVLTTGLATGILINTATYEHKIKYFPISQGVVAATEVIVGGGTGLICTSLDAGANEAGSTEGYAAVGDDEDILIFSFPLPDDFVDTGTQADLILEFDIDEQAAEECNIDIRIFEYDDTANATAIITDTIVAANDNTRAWKGLVTNSAGIGNETDLDQGDHLIIEITATADADDFNIYGMRMTYRCGLAATQ